MSTNVGSLSVQLAMGYDPSGLKLFKADMQSAKQAGVDMIAGLSAAAKGIDTHMMGGLGKNLGLSGGGVDPMMAKLSQWQNGLNQVPNVAAVGAGGNSKIGMVASQLGFGLQDFMSQVQNSKNTVDGLGRGVMAVSNNVQMLGAAWGPTGMAITAIGGAVAGTILPPIIKWVSNSEEIEKATKAAAENYDRIADRVKEIAGVEAENDDKAVVRKGEQFEKEAKQAQSQIRQFADMDKNLADQKRDVDDKLAREKKRLANSDLTPEQKYQGRIRAEEAAKVQTKALEDERKKVQASIKEQQIKEQEARDKLAGIAPNVEAAKGRIEAADEQKGLDRLEDERFEKEKRDAANKVREDEKRAADRERLVQQGLEKNGSVWQKQYAKESREQKELEEAFKDHPLKKNVLEAFGEQAKAEEAKIREDQLSKKLSEMKSPLGAPETLDLGSSRGVSWLNKVTSGATEIDWQKQQLEELKKQTQIQEKIANQRWTVVQLAGGVR